MSYAPDFDAGGETNQIGRPRPASIPFVFLASGPRLLLRVIKFA